MIVYQSTRSEFLRDSEEAAIEHIIAQAFLQKTGRYRPEADEAVVLFRYLSVLRYVGCSDRCL